jgi:hypothetical protein
LASTPNSASTDVADGFDEVGGHRLGQHPRFTNDPGDDVKVFGGAVDVPGEQECAPTDDGDVVNEAAVGEDLAEDLKRFTQTGGLEGHARDGNLLETRSLSA